MRSQTGRPPGPAGHRRPGVLRYVAASALLAALALAPVTSHALRERSEQRPAGPAIRTTDTAGPPAAGSTAGADRAASTPVDTRGRRVAAELPEFTHRSARLEDVARAPVALRIDTLDLTAPVLATGRAADGQLDVPPDAGTVVWYRAGSVPGAGGSAVLAAHVDYDGRPGAFFALDELRPGDTVRVELDDGSLLTFEVFERRRYHKRVLPIRQLFTRNGDAVLTLVTCGGQFNHTTRHYDSNTVVRAALR